jgi:hypothetical protein
MASSYKGLYRIGDKATGVVTDIQVEDAGGSSIPLPLAEYIAREVLPDYQTLPWWEDRPRPL